MAQRVLKTDFQIQLSVSEVAKKLYLQEEEDIELVRSLCDKAVSIAKPKALFKVCQVQGIAEDCVNVDGIAFHSRVMAKNLADTKQVYAYVVTCGREVDDWSHEEKDPFIALWLDMIKELILKNALEQFYTWLAHTQGIKKYATMSPGSGDVGVWSILQQRELFTLIEDVEKDTGIHLTESCLMLPTKSVSGIFYPSEQGFITCTMCTREHCTNRRAPYDPERSMEM